MHAIRITLEWAFPLILLFFAAFAALYNPFSPMHRIRNPFTTRLHRGHIVLIKHFNLLVRSTIFARIFAYFKCAWHIVFSAYFGGPRSNEKELTDVVGDIHELRFDPDYPYLISGDHFSVLYPRNLGVFYHSTLDSRTALNREDWLNRERIYLQTVAYAIEAFRNYGDCTTTIVPIGPRAVSCINYLHYPSDSLYGILYALSTLRDNSSLSRVYPFLGKRHFPLDTKDAADALLNDYRESLSLLLQQYHTHVYDDTTGLIRRNIRISAAKDASVRESAFYDNVIFWKTHVLARKLDLFDMPEIDLDALKARILKEFWNEEEGYFYEDLSQNGRHYSADWLCTVFTEFLDPRKADEVGYLQRAVDYTILKEFDRPFPLKYQEKNKITRQLIIVSFAAPSYGGTSIWSFWGAEFIKLLILLSRQGASMEGQYLERAAEHIASYERNMLRYGGYPEVYRENGTILKTPFYKSVRQTGWVVGFEQAVEMYKSPLHNPAVPAAVSVSGAAASAPAGTHAVAGNVSI